MITGPCFRQAACGRDDSGPRRPTIFRRLLLSIISQRLQGSAPGLAGISHTAGPADLNIPGRGCRCVLGSHPSLSSLCVVLRPQGAPGALVGEGWLPESRPSGSICTTEIAKCCRLELCTNVSPHPAPLPGNCLLATYQHGLGRGDPGDHLSTWKDTWT